MMIEEIDEDTKLVYSYEDGGYFFLERIWCPCATTYKSKKKAMKAYGKKKENEELRRKEWGAR